MNRQERIKEILTKEFSPSKLIITNQSHHHKHHAGDDGTGETHYDLTLVSEKFLGLSRVAKQRLVNNALSQEFADGLHAISMSLSD